MLHLTAVALGGAIGAVLRYLTSLAAIKFFKKTSVFTGTLIANAAGCFLAGILLAIFSQADGISESLILFLTVGVLGSYTTFSTFALESSKLHNGPFYKLALYLFWQMAGVFLALVGGYELTSLIIGLPG
jgi:fluoride exporter